MNHKAESSSAFSLVEITLALGLAAFSLIAIFGLLVTGTQTNYTAIEQSASGDILAAVAADLRATPTTSSTSTQFGITIPSNTTLFFNTVGQSSTIQANDSRYRLAITFLPNGGGRTATFVDLKMTWPASASPTAAATSSAETFVALDRN